MRKIALAIFILLFGLFFAPNNYKVFANAETNPTNSTLEIETIYTDNVLEYANLNNISKIATNNTHIAYSLNNSDIYIFDKSTKETISISSFVNINKIKFVGTQLLVVTDNEIKVVDNFTHLDSSALAVIPDISFTNLKAIDIYVDNTLVYIGYVDGNTFNLNEYTLALEPKTNPIKQVSSTKYTDTYVMAINNRKAYIVSNTASPVMYSLTYLDEEPVTSSLSIPYKVLDTFYANNSEYLLAFTTECLYLLNPNFVEVHKVTTNPIENVSLDITDIDFYGNKIYVSDKKNSGAIQTYTIIANESTYELSYEETLICSNSKSIGRFNNANGITTLGDNILVSDSNNNSIHIIENQTTTYINSQTIEQSPHSIIADEDLNIYVVENGVTNSIVCKYNFSNNGYTASTKYETVSSQNIGYISSTTAHNKTIYLLDYTNDDLLVITNNGMQIKAELTIDLDENSIIDYSKGSGYLVVYNNNTLYLLNNSGTILHSLTTQDDNSSPISLESITSDLNHIYGLHSDTIYTYKINAVDSTIDFINTKVTDDRFTNLSEIHFNIATRKMIAYDHNRACLVTFDHSIIETPFNFENIAEETALTEESTLLPLTVQNSPVIYEYPYHIGKTYNLDGSVLTCFGIEEVNNEYRILFNHKGILTSGFISKNDTLVNAIQEQTHNVITINKKVPIYKYPTILTHNGSIVQIGELAHKTVIDVTAKFPISIDNKVFYKYEYEGKVGYIFNADIVLNDNRTIDYIKSSNATIKAIGIDTINLLSDDKTEIILTLKNDYRIYVEEYDENSEYTKVIYTDENLKSIEGYILTEYIQMDKLDNMQIILIIVIIVSIVILVIIISTYLIIKKKKGI
ncbi:MAG: hypothetical protein E7354_00860 [Clostridiales bacterium]|nr:hypothetical protein [Clostridiales bacterium]